ncbi:hypothetical protein BDK51DRAFT_46337 [Blyttiomyces helicus]|uniref:Uncharacterized protein n=1 Tax=Blyttiomyces helicus TaxID=388810 RepID=A0A4V1IRS5_9FUNG|nr:hypothetical protein BDK51DRAFT_46337 [Blyttiomyces helicus]|eukprot:RKO91077.1 hypothetical protein BDK51DRAFT_46337 [Blyttiomyces helicus]
MSKESQVAALMRFMTYLVTRSAEGTPAAYSALHVIGALEGGIILLNLLAFFGGSDCVCSAVKIAVQRIVAEWLLLGSATPVLRPKPLVPEIKLPLIKTGDPQKSVALPNSSGCTLSVGPFCHDTWTVASTDSCCSAEQNEKVCEAGLYGKEMNIGLVCHIVEKESEWNSGSKGKDRVDDYMGLSVGPAKARRVRGVNLLRRSVKPASPLHEHSAPLLAAVLVGFDFALSAAYLQADEQDSDSLQLPAPSPEWIFGLCTPQPSLPAAVA